MDLETFAQGVCAVLSMDLSQMSKTARQAVANRNARGLNCNSDALFTREGYTANRIIQYSFFFFYVDNLCHLECHILLNDSMNMYLEKSSNKLSMCSHKRVKRKRLKIGFGLSSFHGFDDIFLIHLLINFCEIAL